MAEKQENQILLFAVVQSQDAENAQIALAKLNVSVTRLPSTGGFLGRRNATLLIGYSKGREKDVTATLQENCRQRVEYIAVPLESAPLPLPAPTPITIGGATIFSLEVEHYEEI
ncbi:MAG: cyclic-di-AMP receptor [Anaerolineaceae bacterium]|nr:cyclic-di-AMP receptor [Anaerolineaceae bacterium]